MFTPILQYHNAKKKKKIHSHYYDMEKLYLQIICPAFSLLHCVLLQYFDKILNFNKYTILQHFHKIKNNSNFFLYENRE